jgi:hypothetical protein
MLLRSAQRRETAVWLVLHLLARVSTPAVVAAAPARRSPVVRVSGQGGTITISAVSRRTLSRRTFPRRPPHSFRWGPVRYRRRATSCHGTHFEAKPRSFRYVSSVTPSAPEWLSYDTSDAAAWIPCATVYAHSVQQRAHLQLCVRKRCQRVAIW